MGGRGWRIFQPRSFLWVWILDSVAMLSFGFRLSAALRSAMLSHELGARFDSLFNVLEQVTLTTGH